jgi:outer membrane PBP1 activator LpoA protein
MAYPELRQRYPNRSDQSLRDLLRRAHQAYADGKVLQAQTLLSGADLTGAHPALADTYLRLKALTLVHQNQIQAAGLALTEIVSPSAADLPALEQTCFLLGDMLCFVQARLSLQRLNNAANLQQAHDELWLNLIEAHPPGSYPELSRSLSKQVLAIRLPGVRAGEIGAVSGGWLNLRETFVQAGSVAQARQGWYQWRQRNPRHPAQQLPPALLLSLDNYTAPDITVMLPLSGRLNSAADAVRDGVMTGYLADLKTTDQTQTQPGAIAFLDSNATDSRSLLRAAFANSSDVIVGPLIKSKAAELLDVLTQETLSQNNNKPNLVLLNQVSDADLTSAASRYVYQFAIAIEDEAATLAEHLEQKNHHRLLVVSNGESWAQRAKQTLQNSWRGPIAVADFQQTKDVTNVVGEAMDVAASQQRRNQIAAIIGMEPEFLPRGRKDLDAVVAFTNVLESKALVPALKFHFAEDLPIYGTSQTDRGTDLADLSSFQVTKLPMLAKPGGLPLQMSATFALNENPLIELFALGLDAYRLATWTHWRKTNETLLPDDHRVSLGMASGEIALGIHGPIQRRLPIARVGEALEVADPQIPAL